MTRSTFLRRALASRVLAWIHGARLSTGGAAAAAGSACQAVAYVLLQNPHVIHSFSSRKLRLNLA